MRIIALRLKSLLWRIRQWMLAANVFVDSSPSQYNSLDAQVGLVVALPMKADFLGLP